MNNEADSKRAAGRRTRGTREGFSTGTAAAAAAKAALGVALGRPARERIEVDLPGGKRLGVSVREAVSEGSWGRAVVIKDGGDDPDATHGAEIGVRVRLLDPVEEAEEVLLTGGEGVGRVTKPGLPIPVGEPAINPVPRWMIDRAVREAWKEYEGTGPVRVEVQVFVPRGEEIAKKTLNPRLGILGGISILGTTGLVKPYSHAAYRATIVSGLKVARAAGLRDVFLSTGGKSERFLQGLFPHHPEEAFVQMGDYVGFSIPRAVRMRFDRLVIGAFFGKAVKMAQGFEHTHASEGAVDFGSLAEWGEEEAKDALLSRRIAEANTAREVLELISGHPSGHALIHRVGVEMGDRLRALAGGVPEVETLIFDFGGAILYRSLS